jgi:hypothetical protein
MKFDRADLALTEPMPTRETDGDGEEIEFDDEEEEAKFQKRKKKWLTRNYQAYSFLMEACMNHPSARLVAKGQTSAMAKVLLKNLGERFKIVQQSVKQSEISKFNTLVMEQGETCSNFVDRVKEQAQKLDNMGEKVSNTNLITRLKDGLFKVHSALAHNLYIQGSEDLKVVEDIIRGYDNTPMAKMLLPDSAKSIDKVNFAGEIPRKNSQQMRCRRCNKRGHLEKDCWSKKDKKGGPTVGKRKYNSEKSRKCYICQSTNHLQADCPKNRGSTRHTNGGAKYKSEDDKRKSSSIRKWNTWNSSKPTSHNLKRKHSENETSDNSSVDYSAMMRYDEIKPMESKMEHTEEEPAYVIMDSGSNRFAVNDKTHFDELNENEKIVIQLAKRYSTLKVEGIGKIGEFDEVYHYIQTCVVPV